MSKNGFIIDPTGSIVWDIHSICQHPLPVDGDYTLTIDNLKITLGDTSLTKNL